MKIPEENPVPSFLKELAGFFDQQQQAAEEALRQNYTLHEVHLSLLEQALTHIQAEQPEEAEAALRAFLCRRTAAAQRAGQAPFDAWSTRTIPPSGTA